MSEKHTPGQLAIDDGYPRIAKAADGRDFFITHERGNGEANARRLVACWNACEGISTVNLEDNLPVKELATRYNAVLAQRDELLAALELIANTGMDARQCMLTARAAIAKVEAGK